MNMFSSIHRSTFAFSVKSLSFISLPPKTLCRDVACAMSTDPRRSLESKVEARLRQETVKSKREILMDMISRKQVMSMEEKLIFHLKKTRRRVGAVISQLTKYELPELPPNVHDPELLTPEQLQALKKIGLKNKNFCILGSSGVYGGTILNIHLHWKYHETVQILCDHFPFDYIKETAVLLAKLSGGIVVSIHELRTIILYRGRNYRVPNILTPFNTLTRRKIFFKAKLEYTARYLKYNIKAMEKRLRCLGINPDDPVPMSKSRRIASTFFYGIDQEVGRRFSFHDQDRRSDAEPPFVDSDQEELDKFVSEIEYAADQDFASEEAVARESFGKIMYQNEVGFRFAGSEMSRNRNPNTEDSETLAFTRNEDIGDERRSEDNKKKDEYREDFGGFGENVGERRFWGDKESRQREKREDGGDSKDVLSWKQERMADNLQDCFEYGNEEMKHERDRVSRQQHWAMNDKRDDERWLERFDEKYMEDGYWKKRRDEICNWKDTEENDVDECDDVMVVRRGRRQSECDEDGDESCGDGEFEGTGPESENVGSETWKFDSEETFAPRVPVGRASLDEISCEFIACESDSDAYTEACADYGREEEGEERNEDFSEDKYPKTAKQIDEDWDSD